MSMEATSYVTRHVHGVTTSQRAVLGMVADMCNALGQTRVSLGTIAEYLDLSRRQVERHMRILRELGHVVRHGRSWFLPGVFAHDPRTCGHAWCAKQAEHQAKHRRGPSTRRLLNWATLTRMLPWHQRQDHPNEGTPPMDAPPHHEDTPDPP